MRNTYGSPIVNASLIHEIRMVFQHFFTQRTAQTRFSRKENHELTCALCLRIKMNRPKKAVTMVMGTAVCEEHVITIVMS